MAWTPIDVTNAASWGPITVSFGDPGFQFDAFQIDAFQMDIAISWTVVNDSNPNTWTAIPT